ncbi:MAG: helicase-exonuclease AddAB subunit AddA [Eubacteriales bacterium]
MPKPSYTIAQQNAIDAPVCDLLVCAAAGSGKTTVLTQRVIESLISEENPVDITKMLIVTFTKASAADLKAKISRAITEKMGEEQGSPRLRRQLLELDRAQISTIDGFCRQLLSEHFTQLGLPASPRIGDDAEVSLLKEQVMEQLLNELYEEKNPEFHRLVRNFTALRDNDLGSRLLKIYDTVSSYPEGVAFVREAAEKLQTVRDNGITDSEFGREIRRTFLNILAHFVPRCRLVYGRLDPSVDPPATIGLLNSELADMERILAEPDPARQSEMFGNLTFESLKKNNKRTDAYVEAIALRNEVKDAVNSLLEECFRQSESDQKIAADLSANLCMGIYHLLSRFEAAYCAEKRRMGMLDFADLEQYAYRLLVKDGKPTPTAEAVARRYEQIYIDEYQDSNRLQDEIFKAISRGNRFMVGDIKQSIYSFRGAVPDLFAGYREAFPDYDPENPGESGRIFLSHNFRSRKPMLDFANLVFDGLFPSGSGRVPYVSADDALRFPDGGDPTLGKPVKITLVSGEKEGNFDPEAVYVADQIAGQIASGRSPSDIAILFRSSANNIPVFERELQKRGIPTENSADEDFFECPEILLMLALLGAIDNPRRDVYLAGAMKCPLFGITLDDLIVLRRNHPGQCLYDSLLAANVAHDFAKGERFLDWLEECRSFAVANSVDKLIRMIYRTTALPAVVRSSPDGGEEAVTRLRQFYAFAHSFESGNFRGLHRFMKYLSDAENGKKRPTVEKPASGNSCVRLMSIHKSKGLEFPVVYLCRIQKRVNMEDLKKPLLLDRDMGIAFKLRDDSGYSCYDPVLRQSVRHRMLENLVDEEMRVLYVALTRAKEELYLTGYEKDPDKRVTAIRSVGKLDFYRLMKNACYLDWIFAAIGENDPRFVYESVSVDRDSVPVTPETAEITDSTEEIGTAEAAVTAEEETGPALLSSEELSRRIAYVYPHAAEVQIPSKAVVSGLYPAYLDEETVEVRHTFHSRPSFLEPNRASTGAERGTATHLFMQFCDFENVRRNGTSAELARLLSLGFLDKESASLVKLDLLPAFFESDLFRQMSESPEIHREFRFLISAPADRFTENRELADHIRDASLLVQGVIDCFFLLPDGSYKLVDYKTDRIRSKSNPDQAIATLISEYGNQLYYYRDAIEALSDKKVSQISIYAFELQKEISIPVKN